jgi:lysophospholipase L1-like esterase
MIQPWRKAIYLVVFALFFSSLPVICVAETKGSQEKNAVLEQLQALIAERRFAEAQQILGKFETGTAASFQSGHDTVNQGFSAYVKSLRSEGQQYLLWIFGALPLSFCLAAVVVLKIKANLLVTKSTPLQADSLHFILYFGGIVGITVFSFYIGTIAFYLFPNSFYFREWEYNRYEVTANLLKSTIWNGPVKGERSRQFLFNCQGTEDITVTVNQYGFRATPRIAPKSKILFYGDSLGWAMNVTDEKNFPTVLSKELNQQVFSGLGNGSALLNYPDFDDNPIFLELLAWGRFTLPIEPITAPAPVSPIIQPPVSGPIDAIQRSFSLHTHSRYYLPHLLVRATKRLWGDLDYWLFADQENYIFPAPSAISYQSLDQVDGWVDQIVDRSRSLNRLGFTYIAVPVPEPNGFVAEYVNPRYFNIHKLFRYKAALQGVHVVDLLNPFVRDGGWKLYQQNDGHWNGEGSSLGARIVAEYIREHNLLAPPSAQIGPDTREPRYEEEYRFYLERHFRTDTPLKDRTCVRPLSDFLKPIIGSME